jgi:hypothetical protein
MNKGALSMAALVAAATLLLSGCDSKSTPATTPTISNVSGDYTGTMQDSAGGSGTATATLAQTGSNAGGAITDVEAGGTITAQLSLNISSSNATKGSLVVDYANGTTCTFSTTGTYNSSTNVLAGTYNAVTNCSGQSGTYSLTQQCTDTITSGVRRDLTGIAPC